MTGTVKKSFNYTVFDYTGLYLIQMGLLAINYETSRSIRISCRGVFIFYNDRFVRAEPRFLISPTKLRNFGLRGRTADEKEKQFPPRCRMNTKSDNEHAL